MCFSLPLFATSLHGRFSLIHLVCGLLRVTDSADNAAEESQLKLEMLTLHRPEGNAAMIEESDCLSTVQLVRITLSTR